MTITGPTSTNANIVINGVVGGVTGIDTIPVTDISASFDPNSTINGCIIVDPSSCSPIDDNRLSVDDDPIQDVIEEEVTPDANMVDPFDTMLIEIKENEENAEDPLIDEPVTGAGNDDFWVGSEGDCETDADGNCVSDSDTGNLEPAE